MKSTLFASTLAAALTGTSFGQVEVTLIEFFSDVWNIAYQNEILAFDSVGDFGYTAWDIQVPEDTVVNFALRWIPEDGLPRILAGDFSPPIGPFSSVVASWNEQGGPDVWTGSFILSAGSYQLYFLNFEGIIDFNLESTPQGSCCVNSGCSSTGETTCTELGGTWTGGGYCEDCEPVADDCPADVDGDGEIGFSDVLIILNEWGACP